MISLILLTHFKSTSCFVFLRKWTDQGRIKATFYLYIHTVYKRRQYLSKQITVAKLLYPSQERRKEKRDKWNGIYIFKLRWIVLGNLHYILSFAFYPGPIGTQLYETS